MAVKVLSSQSRFNKSGGSQYAGGKELKNPYGSSLARFQLPLLIYVNLLKPSE